MYAILDIESTGGPYNEEGIMEIAIYRFDGHKVVDQFAGLINPEREIQPFVAKLTGINATLLHSAPKFHEVAQRIIEITKGAILVAHNAQFDYRILRTEFRRLGYEYQRKTLCTVQLSQKLLPEAQSHGLEKLAKLLNIPMNNRHRAQGDALITLALFKRLLAKDVDQRAVAQTLRAEAHGELSPSQFDIIAALPPKTGVYALHNKEGEFLFVGSAANLKKRVTQHFTDKDLQARKLQKETKKVTYEITGSMLVALLKAYQEQRKSRPRYNTTSQKPLCSHAINFSPNSAGHIILNIVKHKFREQRSIGFSSKASAQHFLQKICEEFNLYPASLKPKVPCHQTGIQHAGNTVKDDSPNRCNEKALQAFAKYSTSGKHMVLLGKGRKTDEQSFVYLNNGDLQGFGYVARKAQINHIPILVAAMTPMKGDAHTKFLIESYWRENQNIETLALSSNF